MSDEPKTPLGEKLLAVRNRAITNGMQLKTREEIMNEAPTPEEVEKSLSDVACGVADYSDCAVLRAHIAALEASVENGKESCRAMASCLDRRDDRITKLEAENKRLRNAAEKVHDWLSADYFATHTYLEGMQVWNDRAVAICLLKEAAAQGEK